MRQDLEQIVWGAECAASKRSWKYVLLNLCYHANGEMVAFPSVRTIMKETGYSNKAVLEALAGLSECGIIRRIGTVTAGGKVAKYHLQGVLINVDNLATGELSSKSTGELVSIEKGQTGELSSKTGELSSKTGELSSTRSILNILSSMSGSRAAGCGAGGENCSQLSGEGVRALLRQPTGVALPPAAAAGEIQMLARERANSGGRVLCTGEEWEKMCRKMKTPGWKPKTDLERRYAYALCVLAGASREEAGRFVRYNAKMHWHICDYGTVNDAVKEWVERWKDKDPLAYHDERARRREKQPNTTVGESKRE